MGRFGRGLLGGWVGEKGFGACLPVVTTDALNLGSMSSRVRGPRLHSQTRVNGTSRAQNVRSLTGGLVGRHNRRTAGDWLRARYHGFAGATSMDHAVARTILSSQANVCRSGPIGRRSVGPTRAVDSSIPLRSSLSRHRRHRRHRHRHCYRGRTRSALTWCYVLWERSRRLRNTQALWAARLRLDHKCFVYDATKKFT